MASVVARTFTLGRYTCVERLGAGPVGEVWRAKRFGLVGVERQVYIQKLAAALGKDAAAQARLASTLKTYGELEHEGLLRLLEAVSNTTEAFVVFEFPGFSDLRKLRSGFESTVDKEQAQGLWVAVALSLSRALSQLLADAHTCGLWHGLLSPASIWLLPDGSLRVSELGLLGLLPSSVWTQDATVKALAGYVPPEVLSGASPAGPESDIFALGAILAEILTQSPGGLTQLGTALREIADRARTTARSERFATMAEMAQAIAALPDAEIAPGTVKKALGRIAEQFQLAGDTVPQPVTISERSSAEPLPPPPGKSGDNKVAVSARMRLSSPGDVSGKAAVREISKPGSSAPAAKKAEAAPRSETEDTPLPQSRPLLLTNPKIPAGSGTSADAANGRSEAAGPAGHEAATGEKISQPSRPRGRESGKMRSGMDWLTAQSDSVPVDKAAAAEQEAKSTPAGKPPSLPPRGAAPTPPPAAQKDSGRAAQVGRASSNPPGASTAAKRRSNPVSVNPKARVAPSPAASATTPTADQPVGQVLDAALPLKTQDAESWGHKPDTLSLNETSPALAPVKLPNAPPKSAPEPKPADSADLMAQAAAALSNTPAVSEQPMATASAEPGEGKRRAGPISEPQPRVLSSTAPAEVVAADAGALGASSSGAGSVPTAAATLDNAPQAAADRLVEAAPVKSTRRLAFIAVLGGLLLVGLGLLYKLASGLGTGSGTAGDAGAAARDGGSPAESGTSNDASSTELVITTSPVGRILFDGVDKGTAPQTLKWPGGSHKIVVIADGHKLLRRDVTAAGMLDLKLDAAHLPEDVQGPAQVQVKCKSEGKLRIFVDGHDSGLGCPSDGLSLAPGKHTLSFINPADSSSGSKPSEKKIKVKKGKKPTKVKVKF
ncbi:MAG: protein kinase [Myxococcales bacterium]|nr:protein kinase [Myxococcales bacterium]